MIKDLIFGKTILPGLYIGLDAMTQRQKAIADNIANAQSPGYKRKVVDFEDKLNTAMRSPFRGSIECTTPNHLSGREGHFNVARPHLREADPKLDGPDANAVEMEHEMSSMAETQIKFEAEVKLAHTQFEMLKMAIKGSR
jgi:flagellar basal-body rod protein FlgB